MDGLSEEADGLFERAKEMPNFVPRVYTHGVRLLAEGNQDAARHALGAATAAARDEPITYQTGMLEDLAFRYFQVGLFGAAGEVAQHALVLTDNLPVAAFQLAGARIAQGDAVGERLFDDAVIRFGAHPKGLQLLELVVLMDVAEESARDLMRRHYGASK